MYDLGTEDLPPPSSNNRVEEEPHLTEAQAIIVAEDERKIHDPSRRAQARKQVS